MVPYPLQSEQSFLKGLRSLRPTCRGHPHVLPVILPGRCCPLENRLIKGDLKGFSSELRIPSCCSHTLVQFSRSVLSNSLRPPGLQHARLPCPSPTPRVYPNSRPSSDGHSTVLSFVISFSSCLQSFPVIRVFSNESALCIRWPKYWSFSFSISPSNEHPGLISFRMDWLDLLVVQGTLKSLLQHHNSKASILWHSAFFVVHLLHPYITTGSHSFD